MNITILNLSRKTTTEHLMKLFAPYGTIQSCDIVMDKHTGLSKGFGFVKMSSDEEANTAVASLQGKKKFGGNQIRVRLVKSKSELKH